MSDAAPPGRWPSWGTLGSAASVLVVVVAFGLWVFDVFQSRESKTDAEKRADALRAEFKAEIAEVRKEENRRGASDRNKAAWAAVQSKRIEVVLLRNRVNDCNAKKTKSQMEQDVCRQYDDEFAEATRVFNRLQTEAVNASRGDL